MKRASRLGCASVSAALILAGCSGEAGADGEDGAYPAFTLGCVAVDNGRVMNYDYVEFSTGDAFVSCSVSDEFAGSSDTVFYLESQTGAQTGYCSVTLDSSGEATAGYWVFQFDPELGIVATYHDTGDVNDGFEFVFADSECTPTES